RLPLGPLDRDADRLGGPRLPGRDRRTLRLGLRARLRVALRGQGEVGRPGALVEAEDDPRVVGHARRRLARRRAGAAPHHERRRAVIRTLRPDDDGLEAREEAKARIHAADAAIARLDELIDEEWVREDTAERMRGLYDFRRNRFNSRLDPVGDGSFDERSADYQRLRRELPDADRDA